MISRILLTGLFILTGCSSLPEKDYEVSDLRQASIDFSSLADRRRQQEQYGDALDLYLRAEEYALKRNDQQIMGISKLKRALIHITLEDHQTAQTLIEEVEQANQIEQLELTQAITFVNAKLMLGRGDKRRSL